MNKIKSIAVIGGGIAGRQVSLDLAGLGFNVTIFTGAQLIDLTGKFPDFKIQIKNPENNHNLDVSAIALITEFTPYNPVNEKEYGYKRFKNVITSIELQEMLKTKADFSFGSVTFIQCVGSRNVRTNEYCSSFCCTHAIENALQIKKANPKTDVRIIYMDIRTPYIFEYLYNKARESGIKFIRSRPALIYEKNGKLITELEDTLTGEALTLDSDLVVLSVGAVPSEENKKIARIAGVELDKNGFIKTAYCRTNVKGIFAAGAATGPKNISDSLSETGAMVMEIYKALI